MVVLNGVQNRTSFGSQEAHLSLAGSRGETGDGSVIACTDRTFKNDSPATNFGLPPGPFVARAISQDDAAAARVAGGAEGDHGHSASIEHLKAMDLQRIEGVHFRASPRDQGKRSQEAASEKANSSESAIFSLEPFEPAYNVVHGVHNYWTPMTES